ncbi:MAG: FtsB family cell division protein [Limnochordia bacterium]|jgi:cell division protein FtsB
MAAVRKLEERQKPVAPKRGAYYRINPITMTCFFAGFFLLAALGYLMVHLNVLALSYELSERQGQLAQVDSHYQFLQYELIKARSPENVERQARERLGMIEPGSYEYIVLSPARDDNLLLAQDTPLVPAGRPTPMNMVSAWIVDWFWPGGQAEAGRIGGF